MLESNRIYLCNYKDKINQIDDESIDMILTDIPYLISRDTNFQHIKNHVKKQGESEYKGMKYGEWDKQDVGEKGFNLELYLKECCRIIKPSRSIVVWTSWQRLKEVDDIIKKYLGKKTGVARVGIWRKTNPFIVNMDKMAVQPFEWFIWNRKGSNWTFNNQQEKHINDRGVERQHPEIHYYEDKLKDLDYFVHSTVKGGHPNAKPVNIFEELILTYTNTHDLVFDGCIGGGTTAVAAINTKRQFIGFEIDEKYYEMAQNNINYVKVNNKYK